MEHFTINGDKRPHNYSDTERGYIYLWTLFAVALAGVMLAGVGPMWQMESQREKEMELLFVGDQFRRAIESYYDNSTGRGKRYPESLEQLLEDKSSVATRRHLRKIFLDPMTNSLDWGLIEQPETGISGIYSQSTKIPLKRANFPEKYSAFSEAKSYQDWKFVHAASTSTERGGRQSATPPSGLPNTAPANPFSSGQAAPGADPFSQNQPAASRSNPFARDPSTAE